MKRHTAWKRAFHASWKREGRAIRRTSLAHVADIRRSIAALWRAGAIHGHLHNDALALADSLTDSIEAQYKWSGDWKAAVREVERDVR